MMERGKLFFFLTIVAIFLNGIHVPIQAQSNSLIDELLKEEKATFGKVAYLCLVAAKLIPDGAGVNDALAYLEKAKLGITIKKADEPILLGELAYIIMKVFKMSGGVMYSLIPGPHYACRELAYLGLITGRTSPYRNISGERALQIVSNVVNWMEEQQ
jgi:hypothetical protein